MANKHQPKITSRRVHCIAWTVHADGSRSICDIVEFAPGMGRGATSVRIWKKLMRRYADCVTVHKGPHAPV